MTLATEPSIQRQLLSFDEFLARYSGDNRYELIDGEVFDLEPTGAHEEVAAFVTAKVCIAHGLALVGLAAGNIAPF
jgi:Uma2 family endonuclease